ncbi:MAG TPA: hypothetical protein PKK26_08885 [Candidatus Wallbacteria bacterium]|nr:hypothetical protein [Candidatus Wallbacteria bacterium]
MKRTIIFFLFASFLSVIAVSCINTKSPDVKVVFFLTMIKSGNFSDAKSYIEAEPFTKSVSKKVLNLPNEAIIAILKNSDMSPLITADFQATDEVKMKQLRASMEATMQKDPNRITELTLREMSAHIQSKDIDVVAQQFNEETGEIHIKFSEAERHPEVIIFNIAKKNSDWLITGMQEVVSGWLF